ncbi:MAG: mechanosensitive ion channel [Bacteroidales bacterium]|nr:mechanosensitive ion channel [Bacteroidales bacterium]
MELINKYLEIILNYVIKYGIQILGATIVLIIGLWIIKKFTKAIRIIMDKRDIDSSLKPFFISLLNISLKALLVISVMGMVGIEMTSFIAILGAASLAVGMALSGTLQNFAGGVMILIFKPFKVGDFIDAQGHMGVVKEIQIFNTILTTPDNKTIIIPNGGLSTGSMTNFSTQDSRRVDFVFGIAYGDDLEKAKSIIKTIANNDERIFKDPEPFVRMSELADSSVNITCRFWTLPENYWDVYFDTMESVYQQFTQKGINIPFPQMDVHIKN